MISDDEYLERIVAGIHGTTSGDADVRWNEVLNGRQFDVTVRFELGTLRYMVLIEVKNRSRKTSAGDLEAFVTKSRDQRANKAVFVTAAGFQRGAREVAERHGIDLFTVTFDEDEAELPVGDMIVRQIAEPPPGFVPSLKLGEPTLINVIEGARLVYADGRSFDMPSEASQMTYYAEKTDLGDGFSLNDLVQANVTKTAGLNQACKETIRLPEPMWISPPDDYYFPAGQLSLVEIKIAGHMGRGLTGGVQIEPTSFRHPVIYKNFLTGELSRFSLDALPLSSELASAGKFYFEPHPFRYFYCSEVSGNEITWDLIESFQCGQLIRGTFKQDIKYSLHYIPVSDKKVLQRLKRRLLDYRALQQ